MQRQQQMQAGGAQANSTVPGWMNSSSSQDDNWFDCRSHTADDLEMRTAVKYPSRDEYIASDEGRIALTNWKNAGKQVHQFKRAKCEHFSAGSCKHGLHCGFVHNEFSVRQ